jgi:protease II
VPALDGETIPLTILAEKRSVQYPKKLILKVYGFYGLSN